MHYGTADTMCQFSVPYVHFLDEAAARLLTYPHCGVAAMTLCSAAARQGAYALRVEDEYRNGIVRKNGIARHHTWSRLRLDGDVTHRQFGPPDILVIPTAEEPAYHLHGERAMSIGAGDFERMLSHWERYNPTYSQFRELETAFNAFVGHLMQQHGK